MTPTSIGGENVLMITLRFFHWLSIHLPMRIVSLYQSNGLYFSSPSMRQDMAMLLRISVILVCCIFGIVSNAASVCSLTNTRSTEYSESRSFSTASLNCARCCGVHHQTAKS